MTVRPLSLSSALTVATAPAPAKRLVMYSPLRRFAGRRGVTADRLSTISYGEERPKYDNSREETRRLNRRAALTVNLTR